MAWASGSTSVPSGTLAWLPSTTITREFVPSIFARSKLVSPTASPVDEAGLLESHEHVRGGRRGRRAGSRARPNRRCAPRSSCPPRGSAPSAGAFVSAELASAHFGSSQMIPPTVAPARRVERHDVAAPCPASTPRSATTKTVTPASRSVTANGDESRRTVQAVDLALQLVVVATHGVDAALDAVDAVLQPVDTVGCPSTPYPITMPSARARNTATSETRWKRKLITTGVDSSRDRVPEVLDVHAEPVEERVDRLRDDRSPR